MLKPKHGPGLYPLGLMGRLSCLGTDASDSNGFHRDGQGRYEYPSFCIRSFFLFWHIPPNASHVPADSLYVTPPILQLMIFYSSFQTSPNTHQSHALKSLMLKDQIFSTWKSNASVVNQISRNSFFCPSAYLVIRLYLYDTLVISFVELFLWLLSSRNFLPESE